MVNTVNNYGSVTYRANDLKFSASDNQSSKSIPRKENIKAVDSDTFDSTQKKTNWKKIIKGTLIAAGIAGLGFLGGVAILRRQIIKNSPKVNKTIEKILGRQLSDAEKTKITQNCKKIKDEYCFWDLFEDIFLIIV